MQGLSLKWPQKKPAFASRCTAQFAGFQRVRFQRVRRQQAERQQAGPVKVGLADLGVPLWEVFKLLDELNGLYGALSLNLAIADQSIGHERKIEHAKSA